MFWLSKDGDETVVKAEHLDDMLIGYAPSVHWGNEHPLGWDVLEEAVLWLYEMFEEMGWDVLRYQSDQTDERTMVCQIKEKFGGLRVYMYLNYEDMEVYHEILKWLIEIVPGIEGYLQPDFPEKTEVFRGSYEEAKRYAEGHYDARHLSELLNGEGAVD